MYTDTNNIAINLPRTILLISVTDKAVVCCT